MKILLVNPPASPDVIYSKNNSMYPFSLLFLSSYLKKNGYSCSILDLSTTGNIREYFAGYIEESEYDLVGFTATAENRFLVWDLIREVKDRSPGTAVVAGGKFFTYTARAALENISELDIVVRGEGEITFHELVRNIDRGEPIEDIAGITFRKDGAILSTPDREFEKDLDRLNIREAFHDNVILPGGRYSPYMIMRNYEGERVKAVPVHAGRGCPGRCVFCLHNNVRYRTRSVDSVISEITEKKELLGCSNFHLQDPFLLKRVDFVKSFCSRLIEERLDINFYVETRADIDTGLLELLKEAGCISLDFGLESASQKVLDSIGKGISLGQARAVIDECDRLGIRIKVFTMISLPDEEKEDALKTVRFLEKHRKHITNYSGGITRIYPGSELEKMAYERGILGRNFSWYDRNYVNSMPGAGKAAVPVWIEHLDPGFIRYCRKRIDNIKLSKISLPGSIYRNSRAFVFDWSSRGIKRKTSLIIFFVKVLFSKIKSLCGR
ncbi:MAG: cobalamin-dependent protein [Elusimicrobia bacterium]|nr:cobalamin-dependent protein [Elusimicrobiota bacterium]